MRVLLVVAMLSGCLAATPDETAPEGRPMETAEATAAPAEPTIKKPAPSEASEPTGRTWPEPSTASIRPGARTGTGGGQCTANFVFYDATDIYIGQAAHCSGNGGTGASTDGCTTDPGELGVGVTIEGADKPGTLVYSSWIAMQEAKESHGGRCAYNDFALIRIDPADRAKVSPALKVYGGPVGMTESMPAITSTVYTYGTSDLRGGVSAIKAREGRVTEQNADWSVEAYFTSPGVPGDSGSPVLDADGNALGVLVTVRAAPTPGSNGITLLEKALAYARGAGMDVQLGTWERL